MILTHTNLLANIRAMGQAARATSADVFVSWLPLYHDMGLIGAWLGSLYYAQHLVLMSPLTFLARPARWLWAIHTTVAPSPGRPTLPMSYACTKSTVTSEGLDLSAWRLAFNGAEPVSPDTVTHFGARFAPYGFRPEAMTPVYGLAEADLGLAFPLGRGPAIDCIQREHFMRTGQAVPPRQTIPMPCGLWRADSRSLAITSALWILRVSRWRSVRKGVWSFAGHQPPAGISITPRRPDACFAGRGWTLATWRTWPAVRCISRAHQRSHYPCRAQYLSAGIGRGHWRYTAHPQGVCGGFGSPDPVARTERLVILAETYETDPQILEGLRRHIDTVSTDLLGAPPDAVVLAPPHTVPKTSSGKIRRSTSRELYEQGRLGRRQGAVWWPWMRLVLAGVRPQWRRTWRATLTLLYAAYAWAVFGVFAPLTWGMLALLPRYAWRQAVVRVLARLALRLAGIPLVVHGQEHLPQHRPYVLVVNHTSYLDALVLVAVLPGRLRYVAKRELGELWLSPSRCSAWG